MPTPTNDTHDASFLRPRPSDCLGPPSNSVQPSVSMMFDIPAPAQPAIANGVDDHFFTPSSMSLENWDNLFSFVPSTPAPDASQGFSSATPSVSTTHDCPLESFEVFKDLTAAPSLSEKNTDTTILAQLDQVLQANRNAIDRLTRLLECPCVKPPYLVMLHSSIISRVLGLYQQAAGCSQTVRRDPGTETAEHSAPESGTAAINTSNIETRTSGMSDEAAQLPFSLGKFNIEEPCVQFAFKSLLIGNELKRAGNLISLFASQSPGDGAEGLRSSLSAWLRDNHASTIRMVRSAIKELNDGIDL
ncbi:Aflatoxin biosynthesis regulatory protein [Madurella mycetomatis]|uniref:Aflatoxin biosynthesis regulatory protein n=1 Tax=Madurella mycetomatis TaxID=100816 RepID=A0A175VTG5_9PEZI|nr:Aflatoxin biosynthesis regulatory protein [Madurella mycetomatis]